MQILLAIALLLQTPDSTTVPAYMNACIKKAVAGRAPEQLDQPTRQKLRGELRGMLGLDPAQAGEQRTPLNAKITGRLERDGYAIEKIVYETFPQFYASAYLYLPAKGEKPYPVVVSPVGHWSLKKLEPVVQARCVGLALQGFAVLCIDMPGFIGPNNDERSFPGDHCDWLLHMSSLPPGGVMVWDVVRGIDYLETRPDIDVKRLGLTGESGGGFTTMYTSAVDDRIRCYCPVCYATSYEDNCDNGCFCNHVPGAMTIGDRADVMALAAPRPVLLIGAENDGEFPKAGTLRSHAKLLKHYEALGVADRCDVFVAPGGHDYCKPMRERMYGFMRKHVMGVGDGSSFAEPRDLPARAGDAIKNIEDANNREMRCFADGKPPADAKSLRQLALERARRLIAADEAELGKLPSAALRERLHERLLRIYPVPARESLNAQAHAIDGKPEQTVGNFVSEPGLRVPFKLTRPNGASGASQPTGKLGARILFSERGIEDAAAFASPSKDEPCIELRIDGRGLGQIPGLEMKLAVYLGRPDVWMWAWDVSRAVDYLLTLPDVDPSKIDVWGFGPAGGQVAYLAALLDSRIARTYGQRTLNSYLDAFERDGLPRFALPHRILEIADLPLMRKAVGGAQ